MRTPHENSLCYTVTICIHITYPVFHVRLGDPSGIDFVTVGARVGWPAIVPRNLLQGTFGSGQKIGIKPSYAYIQPILYFYTVL
jgi:hypothetical protein